MHKIDLKSLTLDELINIFVDMGEKPFRGEQVFRYIHQNMGNNIAKISVLSKSLRDKLDKDYKITDIKILKRYDSKIDDTKKYLFILEDGNIIESVAMKYKHGLSVCLSTQVGCKMGCRFCASTKEGFIRNLTTGEILSQVYSIQADLNKKVNNIVLMGSGEPLDNYNNVIKFLKLINSELGQNISLRNITLSTCGIVPKIYELADEFLPITLSISLHSPFDKERKEIMPVANLYTIEEIIESCRYYINKNNRRITFEYTLISGINDREEDLYQLTFLLEDMLCHVNLILLNPIEEFNRKKCSRERAEYFKQGLESKGIRATIRREMGSDINAACGQLRRKYISESKSKTK